MVDLGDEGGGTAGHGRSHALRWTTPISNFMLALLVEIVGQGVKTDKGFKDVHLNQVARAITDFVGSEVTRTQVYNHLRKWHGRWLRIQKLKDISGALWDENQNMICLDQEHYLGYTKDHLKTIEFLNVPLENYTHMATIFENGQAIGKFAMGSNDPLMEESESGDNVPSGFCPNEPFVALGDDGAAFGVDNGPSVDTPGKESSSISGKRKRTPLVSEKESMILTNMTGAVREMANAIRETVHAEAHPDVYGFVMNLSGFPAESLMAALEYWMEKKAMSLSFIQMDEPMRILWVQTFFARQPKD